MGMPLIPQNQTHLALPVLDQFLLCEAVKGVHLEEQGKGFYSRLFLLPKEDGHWGNQSGSVKAKEVPKLYQVQDTDPSVSLMSSNPKGFFYSL